MILVIPRARRGSDALCDEVLNGASMGALRGKVFRRVALPTKEGSCSVCRINICHMDLLACVET